MIAAAINPPGEASPVSTVLAPPPASVAEPAPGEKAKRTRRTKAQIEADEKGRAIRANVERFKAMAEGCEFLFSDLSVLVHKAPEDFVPLVAARVVQHRAAEAAKIEAAEKRAREQEAARIAEQQRQQTTDKRRHTSA